MVSGLISSYAKESTYNNSRWLDQIQKAYFLFGVGKRVNTVTNFCTRVSLFYRLYISFVRSVKIFVRTYESGKLKSENEQQLNKICATKCNEQRVKEIYVELHARRIVIKIWGFTLSFSTCISQFVTVHYPGPSITIEN